MNSIHNAITNKNLYELNLAILSGESPTQTDSAGLTPLDRAAANKDSAAAQVLLKALFGIDANIDFSPDILKDLKTEQTALISSMRLKMPRTTFLTPKLHQAAFNGTLAAFQQKDQRLFDNKDGKGLTPLHYAIAGKQKEVIRFLLDQVDVHYCTANNDSYLHFAALTGDSEILHLFLDKKIDASVKNRDAHSAAHYWAAASNDLDVLKQLGERGAEIHTPNPKQITPLSILLIKSMENGKGPLSGNDLVLFVFNAIQLSALFTAYTTNNKLQCGLATIANVLIEFAKRFAIKPMIWDGQKILGYLTCPTAFYVGEFIDEFGMLSSAATAKAVAQHAMKSLSRCKMSSWLETMAAVPIHLFNTCCSLLQTADKCASYFKASLLRSRSSKRREDSIHAAPCAAVNLTNYKGLTEFKRLTDKTLTAHLGTDKPCIEYNKILLDPINPPSGCGEIKKAYHRLSLRVHPDKNTKGNKIVSERAFRNLKQAYDELKMAFSC